MKIISAKKGNLVSNDGNKYFELIDGTVIEIYSNKVTNFSFDKIIYNSEKYKSKTTTYQKIQEVPTLDLLNCIRNFYFLIQIHCRIRRILYNRIYIMLTIFRSDPLAI